MDTVARPQPDAPLPDLPSERTPPACAWSLAGRLWLGVQGTCVLLGVWALAAVLWRMIVPSAEPPGAVGQLLLPVAMLALVCLVAVRQELLWLRPMRQLRGLAEGAREGQVPIEELSSVAGGVSPLVPVVQALLRDLRAERRLNAELNQEIRQRVANRTDALERMVGSLRRQATQDRLTGLHNRRLFDEFLPRLIERCLASREDVGVLMMDVDHFKSLNDTLGHAAGDRLLHDIGRLIGSTIRAQDAAFRLGGDEFVIVVPGATAEALAALADRLGSLVDALAAPLRLPAPPRLSMGLARLSESPDVTPSGLLARADERLYENKRAARRRLAAPRLVR